MKGQDENGDWYVQSFSGHETNKLFMNEGGKRFHDLSALADLDSDADGRGLALLDYDRDGWQDIVLVNANSPQLELFRNQVGALKTGHQRIGFHLEGGNREPTPSSEWSNRNGYGAKIYLEAGSRVFVREVRCGEGFASQNSEMILIGLGKATTVSSAEIHWPSGKKQVLGTVHPGTINWVHEDGTHRAEAFKELSLPNAKDVAKKETLHLESVSGNRPRVLVTMATWCPSCKEHLPQITLLKRMLGQEFELIGLPVDPEDDEVKLRSYREQFAPDYRLLETLGSEQRQEISEILRKEGGQEVLPSTIVTSPAGEVLWVQKGVPSVSTLAKILAKEGEGW